MRTILQFNLFILLILSNLVIASENKNDVKNELLYSVYYKEPLPYEEIDKYFEKGIKDSLLKGVSNLEILKHKKTEVELLSNIKGKNIPRLTFVKFEIQIEDSLEAHLVLKKFKDARIVYDEMGYQDLEWSIRTNLTMSSLQADSLYSSLKTNLKSPSVCMKNENTAFLIFRKDLSKKDAQLLVEKLKKDNINAVFSVFKFIEIDL